MGSLLLKLMVRLQGPSKTNKTTDRLGTLTLGKAKVVLKLSRKTSANMEAKHLP